jgi:hypothetical protein
MNISTRSLVLVIVMLSSAAAKTPCSMCSDANATLANPDVIVPFLGIGDEDNPTCSEVAEVAPSAATDQICALIQAHANFCGCPESTGAVNACT